MATTSRRRMLAVRIGMDVQPAGEWNTGAGPQPNPRRSATGSRWRVRCDAGATSAAKPPRPGAAASRRCEKAVKSWSRSSGHAGGAFIAHRRAHGRAYAMPERIIAVFHSRNFAPGQGGRGGVSHPRAGVGDARRDGALLRGQGAFTADPRGDEQQRPDSKRENNPTIVVLQDRTAPLVAGSRIPPGSRFSMLQVMCGRDSRFGGSLDRRSGGVRCIRSLLPQSTRH